MKMNEMEILKRAIENTEEMHKDMIKNMFEECIQNEDILDIDDLDDLMVSCYGTSLEFEKNKYELQNIVELQEELSQRDFIKWIQVVVKDNTVSLDVAYEHDLGLYGSLLFKNYVYTKLDYGF